MILSTIAEYIKVKKVINGVIKNENLLENLSNLFTSQNKNYKVTFKKDWLCRIYAVVNPVAADPSSRIFEYDQDGTNISTFLKNWVIQIMVIAEQFVKNKMLFDLLTVDIKQLDENSNFLIVFSPIGCAKFIKAVKKLAAILV